MSESQVNAAYRRFFQRLFDPSEIRNFARVDTDNMGQFDLSLVHGRTIGYAGGVVGVVAGGIAGLGVGVGLTVILFSGSAGAGAGAAIFTHLAPAYVLLASWVMIQCGVDDQCAMVAW
jgi:hypothetical protein